MRLVEAIQFRNLRQIELNKSLEGVDPYHGMLTNQEVGRHLWAGSKYRTIAHNSWLLTSQKKAAIKPRWIKIICELCEVDPNFLFGFPSQYDEHYKKLMDGSTQTEQPS